MFTNFLKTIVDQVFKKVRNINKKEELFLKRTNAFSDLEAKMLNSISTKNNILVIGDRGVGKSTFMKWFIDNSELLNKTDKIHFFIDLSEEYEDGEKEKFLLEIKAILIENLAEYFDHIKHIGFNLESGFDLSDTKTVDAKYREAIKHLKKVPEGSDCFFLFIDDIDYVERNYFSDFLLLIKPLLTSLNCIIILAARKPAYNLIMSSTDYVAGRRFDAESIVKLNHLGVNPLLNKRLNFTKASDVNSLKDEFTKFSTIAEINDNPEDIIKEHLEELENRTNQYLPFPYPFTKGQEVFIKHHSNGNINWILKSASYLAKYILNNYRRLKQIGLAYYIESSDLLKIFLADNVPENLRIQNLNIITSNSSLSKVQRKKQSIEDYQIGNSLLVLLLDCYTKVSTINGELKGMLLGYGLKEEDIKNGTKMLIDMKMIDERKYHHRTAIGFSNERDYTLTLRGEYYLKYLIFWPEYIDLFGISKHFISGNYSEFHNVLKNELLRYMISIKIVFQMIYPDCNSFRISKMVLVEKFNEDHIDILKWLNKSDKTHPVKIDSNYITELLVIDNEGLGLVEEYNLQNDKKFRFYIEKIENARILYNLNDEISFNIQIDETKTLIEDHVKLVQETGDAREEYIKRSHQTMEKK